MRAHAESITDLPMSPDEDRQRRFRLYLILMIVRVVCFFLVFLVPEWWKLIPAVGAVFIPYFAVVLANATSAPSARGARVAPNALPPGPGTPAAPAAGSGNP